MDGDDFAYTREGAHSRPRILYHEDITGKEISEKLLQQVLKLENVTILEYTTMQDIFVENGKCTGLKAVSAEANRARLEAMEEMCIRDRRKGLSQRAYTGRTCRLV